MTGRKRRRGRPATRSMPDLIPDTSENIMCAVLITPPKAEGGWRYLQDADGD